MMISRDKEDIVKINRMRSNAGDYIKDGIQDNIQNSPHSSIQNSNQNSLHNSSQNSFHSNIQNRSQNNIKHNTHNNIQDRIQDKSFQTHIFQTDSGISLAADYFAAGENRKDIAVLYFHGGGLMYGQRNDLPGVYRQMFLDNGYDFIAFDYPLAPESTLGDIHRGTEECVRWFCTYYKERNNMITPTYVLFGRSAGAYLALFLAKRLKELDLPQPFKIISFYGYYGFEEPEFHKPSPFYLRYPAIDGSILERAKGGAPVTSGPMEKRFSFYVCARQKGDWPLWLAGDGNCPADFSLSEMDLAGLPPAFLTASSSDEDVPFRVSKRMSRMIPGSVFYPVYYLEHDFDRDTGRAEGKEVYEACMEWMGMNENGLK